MKYSRWFASRRHLLLVAAIPLISCTCRRRRRQAASHLVSQYWSNVRRSCSCFRQFAAPLPLVLTFSSPIPMTAASLYTPAKHCCNSGPTVKASSEINLITLFWTSMVTICAAEPHTRHLDVVQVLGVQYTPPTPTRLNFRDELSYVVSAVWSERTRRSHDEPIIEL